MSATRSIKNAPSLVSSSCLNTLNHHLLLWLLKNTASKQCRVGSKSFYTPYPIFCHYKNKLPGMSAYPKGSSEAKEEAHVLLLQAMVWSVASPSFSSQTHLRVIALITDSCGQLIYQGPILAVLWSTQHLQGPSPSTNWCSFVAMWWSGLTQMKK